MKTQYRILTLYPILQAWFLVINSKLTASKFCQNNVALFDFRSWNQELPQCKKPIKSSNENINKLLKVDIADVVDIVPKDNMKNTASQKIGVDLEMLKKTVFLEECKRLQLSENNDRQPSILYSIAKGRIGNQMCNFATQYALNKEFGILNYFKYKNLKDLMDTFDLPESNYANSTYHVWNHLCADPKNIEKDGRWIFVNHTTLTDSNLRKTMFKELRYSKYLKIQYGCPTERCPTFYCDIKGFYPHLKDLRHKIFRFKRRDFTQAKKIEKKLRSIKKNAVLVSIHIRLGDVMEEYLTLWNMTLPNSTFFTDAIKHIKRKFGRKVIFFVLSDDMQRARKIFKNVPQIMSDIIFPSISQVPSQHLKDGNLMFVWTPEMIRASSISLALLTLADHSICTYSSFGLWGILLKKKKGDIVFPKAIKKTDIGFGILNANIPNLTFI